VPGVRSVDDRGRLKFPDTLEVAMTLLSALWLPILVSAVLVFVASSLIHMASPWHKTDYPTLANEQQVMDATTSSRARRVARRCGRPHSPNA
jgi:hypothetical protein